MAGACECGDEPSGSMKWGTFLTSLGPVSLSGRVGSYGVVCLFVCLVGMSSQMRNHCTKCHGFQ